MGYAIWDVGYAMGDNTLVTPVGADLCVRPVKVAGHHRRADTEVCPYYAIII